MRPSVSWATPLRALRLVQHRVAERLARAEDGLAVRDEERAAADRARPWRSSSASGSDGSRPSFPRRLGRQVRRLIAARHEHRAAGRDRHRPGRARPARRRRVATRFGRSGGERRHHVDDDAALARRRRPPRGRVERRVGLDRRSVRGRAGGAGRVPRQVPSKLTGATVRVPSRRAGEARAFATGADSSTPPRMSMPVGLPGLAAKKSPLTPTTVAVVERLFSMSVSFSVRDDRAVRERRRERVERSVGPRRSDDVERRRGRAA